MYLLNTIRWTYFNLSPKHNLVDLFQTIAWTTEALDGRAVRKISKRHFFQDIKKSFHGVTQICLKPHQNFFQIFFSTYMVATRAQSFCILEGATELLIELWPKFFNKFNPDMWWANAENFKPISLLVSDLLLFNWKILAIVGLRLGENGLRLPFLPNVGLRLPRFFS